MQTLVVSTEREALAYCVKHRPALSLSFIRPSGRAIALWLRSDNGDAELYSLKLGGKKKLQILLMIGESKCSNSRVTERKLMLEIGMNP